MNLSSGSRLTVSGGQRRLMSGLVIAEVALAMTLLVVGGLSTLDVLRLSRVDPGFEAEGVMTYRLQLPQARYEGEGSDAALAFATDYLTQIEALPGVSNAALASSLPVSGHWGWFYEAEGRERMEDEADPVVLNRIVTVAYFETMGMQLLKGRVFNDFDGREPETNAIIVNETFVRTHLSHLDDPIGARVRANGVPPWYTVIGVTKDVSHYGVDEEMRPGVYQPWRQRAQSSFMVAIRTSGEPEAIIATARATTAEIDPELPLNDVRTMTSRMDAALGARKVTAGLIAIFSTVALLLAIAGIYGVISYTVGQRTQEISIRMAVGAESRQVLGQVVRQGMTLVTLGVVFGVAISLLGAPFFSPVLVNQSATDPIVYGGVAILLLAVAGAANYLPARQAAALDPMKTLRGE